jgi:hypothetical protein
LSDATVNPISEGLDAGLLDHGIGGGNEFVSDGSVLPERRGGGVYRLPASAGSLPVNDPSNTNVRWRDALKVPWL